MYQIGETVPFEVVFRHRASGQAFAPTNHEIAIVLPDGTVSAAAATQVGATMIFRRNYVVATAGTYSWYPVTTDEDITPVTIASIQAGQTWVERLDAAISSINITGVAAAVWNALSSTLTTPGSIGALLIAKMNLISTGNITLVSSWNATSRVWRLYKGDTPLQTFTGLQSGLTGATAITLSIRKAGSQTVIYQLAGVVASDSSLTFDIPAIMTTNLTTGENDYEYDVQVTLLGGRIFSPIQNSKLTIMDDVTKLPL